MDAPRIVLAAAIIALSTACAGSPTAPAPAPLPTSAPATSPEPSAPTPAAPHVPVPTGLRWTTTGGQSCGAATPSGIRAWTVAVEDAGPRPVRAVYVAHHDELAGCQGTEDNQRPIVGIDGPRTYAAHASGSSRFSYDTHAYNCGRVQVDVSFLDDAGNDTLVLGEVINYGRDCAAPPAPPAAAPVPPAVVPPPSVVPPPPAPPVPPEAPSAVPTVITPASSCPAGVTGQITRLTPGGTATGVITVPAGVTLTASFVSYEAPGVLEDRYPQTVIHSQQVQALTAGRTTFTVTVPNCYYQVDLVCGAPLPQITDTIRYGARRLDSRHGGSQSCQK